MDRRLIFLLMVTAACAFIITNCVSVEMPEHMVSDSVHAGKDVYRSFKNGKSKQDADDIDPKRTFRYTRVGHEDETLKMVKEGCIEKAEQRARKKLSLKSNNDLEYNVISEEGEVSEDHIIVRCAIMVHDDKENSQKEHWQDQVPSASP